MPTQDKEPIKKYKIFKEKLKKNCVKGLTFNAFLLYYYKRCPQTEFFYNECTIYIYNK